jgi:glyoxylase-like metal-dependent hydrolase (beta-lactamase superfamily II)
MHNRAILFTACAFCLIAPVPGFRQPISHSQQRPVRALATPDANAELTRLAEGIYVQVVNADGDAVSNSGVVVLESGVLVYDTHFTPEAGAALSERIKAVTPLPVRYIVNSHYHPDHTHGNQSFPGARMIVGSDRTRREMLERDIPKLNQAQTIAQSQVEQLSKELGQGLDPKRQEAVRMQLNQRQAYMRRMSLLKILPPAMTFEDGLSIADNGREAQLLFLGAGHTDGDVVLFMPQDRVAFLGDLFFHDGIPNVEDANLGEWVKTLRETLKLDARTFVPGHGSVGTRADVEGFIAYFEDLKALVEPAVTRGDSLEQVVQDTRTPAKYAAYAFQSFFPANLQKMYAEIKAAQLAAAQEKVKK